MFNMRYVVLISPFFLTACAQHTVYQQQARQTASLQYPPGIVLTDSENYYPVTLHSGPVLAPSLVPPGSLLKEKV